MHNSLKLSLRNLATGLLVILIFNINNIVAVFPNSSSSGDLHALVGGTMRSRTSSLGNVKELASSESGSSDGESSDRSSDARSKLKRADATVARIFKRTSMLMDVDRKMAFLRERWERARRTAATAAVSRARTTVTIPRVSPIVTSIAPRHATLADLAGSAAIDLGDMVPSATSTTRMLSLACTPVITAECSRKTPTSPLYLRTGCFEFWFEKTK